MAAPACAHVLLEAVARVPHEGGSSSGIGYRQACSDPDGDQQQELLASVTHARDADRDDERLAQSAGLGECP